MFDNDKLQKNMMDMEYTQNRKEWILHAELISACWHTLFTDIQWSQNNSQLRRYSQDSLQTISYLISLYYVIMLNEKGHSAKFMPKRHSDPLLTRLDRHMTKIGF